MGVYAELRGDADPLTAAGWTRICPAGSWSMSGLIVWPVSAATGTADQPTRCRRRSRLGGMRSNSPMLDSIRRLIGIYL